MWWIKYLKLVKINLFNQNHFNKKNVFCLLLFIGLALHLIYLFQFDDYFDDWNFFFTVDSNISDSETWQRHYFGSRGDGSILKEAFPWNFTYFTKYVLKFIGYSVENTHYFLFLFSVFSYFAFYKIADLILKDFKFVLIATILFITNLFLIRELNSFRPHSLVMLMSLLSNYFFILIFIKNQNTNINFIFYIISTLLMLSFWPHSLALLGGHFSFLFIIYLKKNNNFLLFFWSPLVILILYILLNYKYLQYVALDNNWSYTHFDLTFFINFFFRSFFGSIVFGGIMLLVFAFYLIEEVKINFNYYKKNNFLNIPLLNINVKNFILFNILAIYSAVIVYSILKESVIAPKYFLILIPLIIIWVSLKINKNKKNYIYNFIIIFSLFNSIYFWNDLPIDRPPTREALKIINNLNIKKIYTTESSVFNNYLSNYNYAIHNKLIIKKLESLKMKDKTINFAILCLNYPRFKYGATNKKLEDLEPQCEKVFKNKDFRIQEKIFIPDFLIAISKSNY